MKIIDKISWRDAKIEVNMFQIMIKVNNAQNLQCSFNDSINLNMFDIKLYD